MKPHRPLKILALNTSVSTYPASCIRGHVDDVSFLPLQHSLQYGTETVQDALEEGQTVVESGNDALRHAEVSVYLTTQCILIRDANGKS